MKFKIDENLPVEVAQLMREAGHDAFTALEQRLGGAKDQTIASVCQQERRALVTLDAHFADIRAYPPGDFAGARTGRQGAGRQPPVPPSGTMSTGNPDPLHCR